jgi:1,2-dihydroxy-3-keto-5-methylthiopentene dioxygenase
MDVIRMHPEHPDREALRRKFLSEHRHTEDEVRFFVEGSGAFYLHADGKVFRTVCERGDLMSVPDGMPHWFDAGARPSFAAIRLFTNTEGWAAHYTGSDIAEKFPAFGD